MEEESHKRAALPQVVRKNAKRFLIINAGVLLLSIGVYFFKFPNNFSTGGVSGIAIILSKLVPGMSSATLMSVINVWLLIVGFLFLSKGFGFWTTYCSLMSNPPISQSLAPVSRLTPTSPTRPDSPDVSPPTNPAFPG